MNINYILKKYTRKDFIDNIKESDGEWILNIENQNYDCPNDIGLKDINDGDCGYIGKENCKCKEC